MMPHTVTSDKWEIEDLNRIINTTGSLATVLQKMGIAIEQRN